MPAGAAALRCSGRCVLDVGTGSGVLAIAAGGSGAARALGIDTTRTRSEAAQREPRLNPEVQDSRIPCRRLVRTIALPRADIVTANLTGACLVRPAGAAARSRAARRDADRQRPARGRARRGGDALALTCRPRRLARPRSSGKSTKTAGSGSDCAVIRSTQRGWQFAHELPARTVRSLAAALRP